MTLPAWWGKERQDRNTRSRKQEAQIAKDQGGRVTPGSGSSWRSPGDVTKPQMEIGEETHLIEAKFTDKEGFRLDRRIIRKHWDRAQSLGKEPVIVIEFSRGDSLKVAVIPYE